MWRFLNLVLYFCIRKSYPNKQSDADHGNWNGYQLITRKRGNSSNSLDFKGVYPFCRITKYFLLSASAFRSVRVSCGDKRTVCSSSFSPARCRVARFGTKRPECECPGAMKAGRFLPHPSNGRTKRIPSGCMAGLWRI